MKKKGLICFLITSLLLVSMGVVLASECDDHMDNDGNGYCDFISQTGYCEDGSILGDPNCESFDDSETTCSPSEEICDSIDNDCDGEIDEYLTETRICGSDIGECSFGSQTRNCYSGAWGAWSNCLGGKFPSREICDKKDNDCDGETDESCEGIIIPDSQENLEQENLEQQTPGEETFVAEKTDDKIKNQNLFTIILIVLIILLVIFIISLILYRKIQ